MKLSRRTAPSHAGQCVLVTGGASGLGLELVKLFVADAARVVVADLHAERPASVPDGVDYLTLDVRDDAAWADALAWVEQHWGRLDILVNNAGIAVGGRIDTTAERSASVSRADVAAVIAASSDEPATIRRSVRFNTGDVPIAEAVAWADVVTVLAPDQVQAAVDRARAALDILKDHGHPFAVSAVGSAPTPRDAVICFLTTGIDHLVMHDTLVSKNAMHKIVGPLVNTYTDVATMVMANMKPA